MTKYILSLKMAYVKYFFSSNLKGENFVLIFTDLYTFLPNVCKKR